MIGSLLYLTASRPDLCYSVGLCARYQACPRVSHLNVVKRIIKYVKGTVEYRLSYTKHTNHNLAGFCDADWSGCLDGRQSTSGGCFFLGNNLIAFHSKKQNCVYLSSTQAEYIAMGSCCTQLPWMKQMLADYGMTSEILLIHCDNTGAIDITKNPVHHIRTKHIGIRHHFIRELVEGKLVEILYIDTEKQLADIFTKPLDLSTFTNLQKSLGTVCSKCQSVQYRVHVKTNFKARVNWLSHRFYANLAEMETRADSLTFVYWIPGTNRTTLRPDRLLLIDMVLSSQRAVLTLPTDTLSRSPRVFRVETAEAQNAAPPFQTSRTLLHDDLADLLAVAIWMKRRLDGENMVILMEILLGILVMRRLVAD
ncbi:hypothetical protein ISN45_Aa07g008040 [Arabidopsis thaliana x Arabidopsis arenosa]|uniref:Uncharacterized protein n=1 Tax=Arabidopsis thaliana x Arabidopsis arenosa TaxID=1240361 RepID=A0A8T1Y0R2_9BRAS|nr:hypothetical protein ISN45_Aa07g008040 [Arabidopsis thaliana x Arabidopsis arenosa]